MKKLIKTTLAILILGLMLVSTISFALLSVHALVIDSVTVADKIAPGETTRITIGIDNNGDNDIKDVSIILDLTNVPFAPFDSSSEFGIDEIDEGKRKLAQFEVIALNNAKSGIYKIPVITSYIEEEQRITKNSLISIVVNSKPEIDVSVDDSLLLKGQNNEIIVKVTNKGLSDAKFVEVEIQNSIYINLLSPTKQYIGDVDSDDFDSVKVKVYLKENIPDNSNFPVSVIFRDDLNKKYKEDFNIKLPVYTEKKAIELGLMKRNTTPGIVTGIIFIVVLYFIYRRLKKRVKDKAKKS